MIQLSTFEKNKLNKIRDISESHFERLKADCEIINLAHTQLVIFKYLQLNLKDYAKFINETSSISVASLDIKTLTSESLLLEANKLVLNILFAFKFFIDNAETYLKRKFGKNSTEVDDYKKLLSQHYDDKFAYRFLSKLRDYSIHIRFPMEGLGFKAEKNTKNPEKMFDAIELLVSLETIQAEKGTFRGIHEELLNLEEDVDLRPLIYDLSQSILDIQDYIYALQSDTIEDAISDIETFVGKAKTKNADIKVLHGHDKDSDTFSLQLYSAPFDKIEDFKQYKTGANSGYKSAQDG